MRKVYNHSLLSAPVLKNNEGMRVTGAIALDPTKVTSFASNDKSVQVLPPGLFAAIDGNTYRPLPRQRLTVSASGSTTVSVKYPHLFVVGDAIGYALPNATITLSATGWVANDTVTVTVNGIAFTVTGVGTDPNAIATSLAAAINPTFEAYANGRTVIVMAESNYPIVVAKTSTNGTVSVSSAALTTNSLGTITAVNVPEKTLTLSTSVTLPANLPIGVNTAKPHDVDGEGYGLLNPMGEFNLVQTESYSLYTSATVYRERLPYWDIQLAKLFPGIV